MQPFLLAILVLGSERIGGVNAARHGDEFPHQRRHVPLDSSQSATADTHHPPSPFWHHRLVEECRSSSPNSWGNNGESDFQSREQQQQNQEQHFFGDIENVTANNLDEECNDEVSKDFSAASALAERGGENSPFSGGSPRGRSNPDSIQTRRGTFSSRATPTSRPRDPSARRISSANSRRQQAYNMGGYHSPVLYQYFAARGSTNHRGNPMHQPQQSSQLNFIILGPNVDHWKAVGPILASRGFNVMVCERVEEEHDEDPIQGARRDVGNDHLEDAPNLVLQIMDSLKWNRVVLVGCDEEAILAIETAILLAPSGGIAGLVLCGDLTEASQQALNTREGSIDGFLSQSLECPHVIIWDGGVQSSVVSGSSAHAAVEGNNANGGGSSPSRCVILGGGSVPHRTKPEQFSWILTRFVQERVVQRQYGAYGRSHPYRILSEEDMTTDDETDDPITGVPPVYRPVNNGGILQNLNLPFGINSLVSPEGRLLLGRAVAAALFYISIAKVLVVQYNNLRAGVMSIRSGVDSVDALRRKVFHAVGAFVVNFGYIPRLVKFSFKRAREVDEDEDDGGGGIREPVLEGTSDNPEGQQEQLPLDGQPRDSKRPDEDVTKHGSHGSEDPNGSQSRMEPPPLDDEVDRDERPNKFKPLFFLDNIIT
ncbi:hypothetical protein IV203_023260 [Nitzschia inconspicua]|uniref:Uncharacterized protein n=1 Tax=Nitzschia inconspicua TaxID=303405 RepID=A0A9K3PDQ5_9STRA|nr:hypothetical protein IV203_023260 [Nitzschia inconspicua]